MQDNKRYIKIRHQEPVVQKVDNDIHRRNLYPVDSAIGFPNTYLLESDLSNGQRYPSFEQQGPEDLQPKILNTKTTTGNSGLDLASM